MKMKIEIRGSEEDVKNYSELIYYLWEFAFPNTSVSQEVVKDEAMKKLKAWERLKDKGFRFSGVEVYDEGLLEIDGVLPALKEANDAERLKMVHDLFLLFEEKECSDS